MEEGAGEPPRSFERKPEQNMEHPSGKNKYDSRVRTLAVCGLFTAIITVLTLFASVPLPVGNGGAYLNAGDAAVFASAYVLGPYWGAVVSGLGSALADILHGSAIYAPATLVIKALMALTCGLMIRRLRGGAAFIAGLIMPLGYCAFEWMIFDKTAALTGLWMNAIQYAFGAIAASLIFCALRRAGV